MNANPRLVVVAALAMILVYVGVVSLRSGQRGRSERAHEATRSAGSRVDEPPTLEAYEVASAYTLRLEPLPDMGDGRFSPEMGEALERELAERMGDVELVDASRFDDPPRGGLGELVVRYRVDDQSYGGSGSDSYRRSSVPGRVEVELEVESARGTSPWDGRHRAEATVDLPTTLRVGAAHGMYEEYAAKLAERVADAFPGGGRFQRD